MDYISSNVIKFQFSIEFLCPFLALNKDQDWRIQILLPCMRGEKQMVKKMKILPSTSQQPNYSHIHDGNGLPTDYFLPGAALEGNKPNQMPKSYKMGSILTCNILANG
uniref:DEAD-box ATP-dependent RNA helicase 57-like n=2 Tax=Rhizophora mucronata TaxID=61149 RepID=A0A2P2M350_RHIMU